MRQVCPVGERAQQLQVAADKAIAAAGEKNQQLLQEIRTRELGR